MPLSCRCSHHISIRITNSEFSRIFTKTESFGKTDQTKIHNSFLMKRCGDQHLQKICNPALPLFVYLWIPPQTIYSFRGYSLLLFLGIFIGNLLCCWDPLYNNYAWCFLVVHTTQQQGQLLNITTTVSSEVLKIGRGRLNI